jgi:hypothetical protein
MICPVNVICPVNNKERFQELKIMEAELLFFCLTFTGRYSKAPEKSTNWMD